MPTGQTGPLEYMDPWYGTSLDMPQRFGADPFWTLSPGQSYLRLDHAGLAAGVSTENMWWGPAVRNSITTVPARAPARARSAARSS